MLARAALRTQCDARTGRRWTILQRLKNYLICVGLRALLPLADRLPERVLPTLGRAVGLLAYVICRRSRATAHANLTLVLPERKTTRLARSCFVRAGENLACSLLLRRPGLRALDLVSIPEEDRLLL